MKLTIVDKNPTFKMNKVREGVYDALREQGIKLPLQIFQQYFHIYKPQKYTHPNACMAYAFTVDHKGNTPLKGYWGQTKQAIEEILGTKVEGILGTKYTKGDHLISVDKVL